MKVPILVSYAFVNSDDSRQMFDELVNDERIDVLLDCGAFSAKNAGAEIKLEDYCKFLDEYKDRLVGYLALDVVGNPKATEANLQEMIKSGYEPMPVHVLGDDGKRMDELFDLASWVALAGLRRPKRHQCPPSYLKQKMQWAAGRKVHLLGYVRADAMKTYRPYSVDSASWNVAQMWGWLYIYNNNGDFIKGRFHHRNEMAKHRKVRETLLRFGVTPDRWNDPKAWRYTKDCPNFTVEITIDAFFRYIVDAAKNSGTRIFIAYTLLKNTQELLLRTIKRYEHDFNSLGEVYVRGDSLLPERTGRSLFP